MAIIETANTLSTFEKLKKDLFKIVGIFAILGMIIFSAYYVYLIVKNVEKTVYLVVYSVLFLVIIASFFVEILLKNKEEDTRKERREVLEKKRLLKSIIKYPKYIAKTILVVLAIIETATDFDLELKNIFHISRGLGGFELGVIRVHNLIAHKNFCLQYCYKSHFFFFVKLSKNFI